MYGDIKKERGFDYSYRFLFPCVTSGGTGDITADVCLSRATHMRRHIPRKDGCLPASRPRISLVTSPPYLFLNTPGRRGRQSASQPPVKKGESRQIYNLLYDVIPSSKGITTNLYRGTNIQYGGVCPVLYVSQLLLYGAASCPLPL